MVAKLRLLTALGALVIAVVVVSQPASVPQAAMATLSGMPNGLLLKVVIVCCVWTKLPMSFLNKATEISESGLKYHSTLKS